MPHAPASPRPRAAVAPAGLLVLLAFAAGLDGLGCALTRTVRVPPVPTPASMAFAEGQAHLRAGELRFAREDFQRAAQLDPDWVAPLRALDDLSREDLLAADALARRRAELERDPDSAGLWYLTGRLEGAGGIDRFEEGIEADGDLAWNHHGLAWNAFLRGDVRSALRHGRRALDRARDTWERSYFTIACARYELSILRVDRATRLLEERLAEPDVLASDRTSLSAWLAQAELASSNPVLIERGFQRATQLLAEEDPSAEEAGRLVAAMLENPAGRTTQELVVEIGASLAARGGPSSGAARRRLRAELLVEGGAPALALGLLREDGPARALAARRLVTARFELGEAREAVEDWLAGQPSFLLGDDGLPRDPRLAAVVHAARGADDVALGEALVEAGWFAEARALASRLAGTDLEAALSIEGRASAGIALLGGVDRILRLVDRGQPYVGPWAQVGADADEAEGVADADALVPRPIEGLDELLSALEPLFAAFHRASGGGDTPQPLGASPRSSYGPAAVVVHPGPTFSERDEASGLGKAGAPVGGLAAELDRLGRFGIFGQAIGGGGPDGTLLRRVLAEEKSGEHLGVPWSGLVAWCDGADVKSRPGRRGARISGAALHEGYWIDLDAVREEEAAWRRLEEKFFGPEADADRTLRAIASRGLAYDPEDGVRRGALVPLLGEADRVRLAVLAERLAKAPDEQAVTFEELLRVTAVHEEGHLCDRTRFLPLGRNLFGALGLLLQSGFSPAGVAEMLEYRAQLIAICEAEDPRLPLGDVLGAAEHGNETTPHAAAYTELLRDWLVTFEEEYEEGPRRFRSIDRGHMLVHQVHHLRPEEVRQVATRLARKRGLDRR